MVINETIRTLRIEKRLTQEQLAAQLGVSAPAVSKWENAESYPDITLLPPLARILGTDMNSLLSFQENPTPEEINGFLTELMDLLQTEGWEAFWQTALDKLREYPASDQLVLQVGILLEGIIIMFPEYREVSNETNLQEKIRQCYLQAQKSSDVRVSNQATERLFYQYLNELNFEMAEKQLKLLPERESNPQELKALLASKKGDKKEAQRIWEQNILKTVMDIQLILNRLLDEALKTEDFEQAEYLGGVLKGTSKLFELWDYNPYAVDFQIGLVRKDKPRTITALTGLLEEANKPWDLSNIRLYQHIKKKDPDNFGQVVSKGIIDELKTSDEVDFLKDEPEFQKILDRYSNPDEAQ